MNIKDFYQIFLQSSNTVIDSRKVQRGSVFFAFSGDTFNAAEKSSEALENGAIAVIVEDDADVVMGLVLAMKDVDACVDQMKAKRKPGSNLWMVYPKAKKGLKPDVNRDILFAYTQDRHQLIANGNIALDEDYSMLRFKDLI